MILFDFKCSGCNHVFEELVKSDTRQIPCPECAATAYRAIVKPPRIDRFGIGAQRNASPESIDYFERVHKQQTRIEEAYEQEHGDYGPAPGAD